MSRAQYDYSQLEGQRQNLQNQAMSKIQNYSRVKQGVSAFNKANEQGNLIKDGLGTGIDLVKDATIEGGLAFTKKALSTGASKIADLVDNYREGTGGIDAFNKRLTSRITNRARAALRNRRGAPTEEAPTAESGSGSGGAEVELGDVDRGEAKMPDAASESYFKDVPDEALQRRVAQADTEVSEKTGLGGSRDAQNELDYRKSRQPDAEPGDEAGGAEGGADAGADVGADAADVGADAADVGEDAAGIGEDLAAGVGEAAAEGLGDLAAEAGLSLLDATGVGAIIGVPLQIATGVGAVWGAVDIGKHLFKDFTDLFKGGDKKGDEKAPPLPTFSTKLIAPVMES